MAERQPSKLHVASSNLVSRSTLPTPDPSALTAAAGRLRAALASVVRPDAGLAADAEALSARYRSGERLDGAERPVRDARGAAAYAATRMPATFAAASRAMLEGARSLPGFDPRSVLDLGAGTGASTWAAAAVWPRLESATLLEREPAMVDLGRRLAASSTAAAPIVGATWVSAVLDRATFGSADLVVVGYVLGELQPAAQADLIARAWAATTGALVLVEPGSAAGCGRILAARDALIASGASIVAPCPGNVPCPVRGPEWCHFLARLDRSPLHRGAKAASLSWEDEPYSYAVAARSGALVPATEPAARVVLGRPRHHPGRVELRLCEDGRIDRRTVSRREGPMYRAARDLEWGDRAEPPSPARDRA